MVYVFLADGFEEIEAIAAIDILRRAGITVKAVSVTSSLEVEGSHRIRVGCDMTIGELTDGHAGKTAYVLPGGMPGTTSLMNSVRLRQILTGARSNDLLCAICAAPSVLGEFGLLMGKEATCFPGFEKHLAGARYVDMPVVKSGNTITAKGAGNAVDFALAIVEEMRDESTAAAIRNDIQL